MTKIEITPTIIAGWLVTLGMGHGVQARAKDDVDGRHWSRRDGPLASGGLDGGHRLDSERGRQGARSRRRSDEDH